MTERVIRLSGESGRVMAVAVVIAAVVTAVVVAGPSDPGGAVHPTASVLRTAASP